jgi:transcriptional regulator with XRE-family HTH domain
MNAGIDGELIRKLRTAKSWSQEELGQISGLSARTIQRIETEGSGSLDSRRALASAFGLVPEDLLATQPTGVDTSQGTGDEVFVDRPRLGAGLGAMLWTSMTLSLLALLLLVAASVIGASARKPVPAALFVMLGITVTSGIAVSAYFLWMAANTSYRLSAAGLQVRYGLHRRHYRWDDFAAAYWQRGLLPVRLTFQPVTRFSEVLTLESRYGGRMLDLTPHDTAGFMRQISAFAPQLRKTLLAE